MAFRIFVDGQEGTTGLRIHEMLARRSDVEVLRIDADKRKDAAERARLLNAADVAFLCLPDAAAKEAAALVTNPNTCLIDASTAHRTLPSWVFGLPELAPGQREKLRQSKRIANPGCHASAFIVLLLSGLSFLGLGVQPPNADWGSLVKENIGGLSFAAPAVIAPCLAIASLTISVNLLIDNLPVKIRDRS